MKSSSQHSTGVLLQEMGPQLVGTGIRRVNTLTLPSPYATPGSDDLRQVRSLPNVQIVTPPARQDTIGLEAQEQVSKNSVESRIQKAC